MSNLSHELRNPLTTILGWTQTLRTRQFDEATLTRALETIERRAQSQAQLIEDILDVSRVTSGKLNLNTRLFNLASIVNIAIDSVQLSAEAKSIQIISQPSSAPLVGDVDRLQQVLWNLLTNAIKFTPAGGRVEIMVKPVQNCTETRVSDTGQGIPALGQVIQEISPLSGLHILFVDDNADNLELVKTILEEAGAEVIAG